MTSVSTLSPPSPAPGVLESVVALEIALLDPAMRQDGAAFQSLLHPDFTELSPTGHVYDRRSILEVTAADATEGMTIEQLSAEQVAPGAVLVTYRSHRGERTAWRSSLWLRGDDDRWLLRHHQGTPVRGLFSV